MADTNSDLSVNGKEPDKTSFLTHVINSAKEKQLDSQLSRHHYILKEREVTTLSVHYLLIEFAASGGCNADFLDFMKSNFPTRMQIKILQISIRIHYSMSYDMVE